MCHLRFRRINISAFWCFPFVSDRMLNSKMIEPWRFYQKFFLSSQISKVLPANSHWGDKWWKPFKWYLKMGKNTKPVKIKPESMLCLIKSYNLIQVLWRMFPIRTLKKKNWLLCYVEMFDLSQHTEHLYPTLWYLKWFLQEARAY